MLLRLSAIIQLGSTAGLHVTPAVTDVWSTNEKSKCSLLHCCPLEQEKDIWDSIKMTTVPLKLFLCRKLMNVCNFNALFECLISETLLILHLESKACPSSLILSTAFLKLLQSMWQGVGIRKKCWEFWCYGPARFVVFACSLWQRQFSKVWEENNFLFVFF